MLRLRQSHATARWRQNRGGIRQCHPEIVSKAVAAGSIVDIFAAAGLKHPDISILSDEFLEEAAIYRSATSRWNSCRSSSTTS